MFFNIPAVVFDFSPNCSNVEVETRITSLKSSPEALVAAKIDGIAPKACLAEYPRLTNSSRPALILVVETPYSTAQRLEAEAIWSNSRRTEAVILPFLLSKGPILSI